MGGGVPCIGQWGWHRQMATSVRGSRTGQYHMHSGFARMCIPYNGLQQSSGQNIGRATRATRYDMQMLFLRFSQIWEFLKSMYFFFCSQGTRIGQASECFVYWKDPMTNDTWGLNFTSPIDAKQFRECCVSCHLSAIILLMYSFDCLFEKYLFFICSKVESIIE